MAGEAASAPLLKRPVRRAIPAAGAALPDTQATSTGTPLLARPVRRAIPAPGAAYAGTKPPVPTPDEQAAQFAAGQARGTAAQPRLSQPMLPQEQLAAAAAAMPLPNLPNMPSMPNTAEVSEGAIDKSAWLRQSGDEMMGKGVVRGVGIGGMGVGGALELAQAVGGMVTPDAIERLGDKVLGKFNRMNPGQALTRWGESYQEGKWAPPEEIAVNVTQNPGVLTDPRFWLSRGPEVVGTMLSFMAGGYLGGAVAGVKGAVAASALFESVFEGGLAYHNAIEKGQTPEDAAIAAAKVMVWNLALTPLQSELVFGRGAAKVASKTGRAAPVVERGLQGVGEGLQEVAQDEAQIAASKGFDPEAAKQRDPFGAGILGGVGGFAAGTTTAAVPPVRPPPAGQPKVRPITPEEFAAGTAPGGGVAPAADRVAGDLPALAGMDKPARDAALAGLAAADIEFEVAPDGAVTITDPAKLDRARQVVAGVAKPEPAAQPAPAATEPAQPAEEAAEEDPDDKKARQFAQTALDYTGGRGNVWDLVGDKKKKTRAVLMEMMSRSEKVPLSKAGINRLMERLYEFAGIYDGTIAEKQERLVEWLKKTAAMTPPVQQAPTKPTGAGPAKRGRISWQDALVASTEYERIQVNIKALEAQRAALDPDDPANQGKYEEIRGRLDEWEAKRDKLWAVAKQENEPTKPPVQQASTPEAAPAEESPVGAPQDETPEPPEHFGYAPGSPEAAEWKRGYKEFGQGVPQQPGGQGRPYDGGFGAGWEAKLGQDREAAKRAAASPAQEPAAQGEGEKEGATSVPSPATPAPATDQRPWQEAQPGTGEEPTPIALGNVTKLKTDNFKIRARWARVKLDEVITSFMPGYWGEALQPRLTDRAASRDKIDRDAKNFDEDQMFESVLAGDGAANVIRARGGYMTVSRNHGLESAKQVRQKYPERWAAYQAKMAERAEENGLPPPAEDGSEIDVRIIEQEGLTVSQLNQFAREANEPTRQQMSSAEQALADANAIKADGRILELFRPSESGEIATVANMPFIRAFIDRIASPNTRNRIWTDTGGLQKEGRLRITHAIFAIAYPDPELLSVISEEDDPDIKNIIGGMLKSVGPMARLRDLIDTGNAFKVLDITSQILQAVQKVNALKRAGENVASYMLNQQMFATDPVLDALIEVLGDPRKLGGDRARAVTGDRVAAFFRAYAEVAEAQGGPQQVDLKITPTAQDAIRSAIRLVRSEYVGYEGGLPFAEAAGGGRGEPGGGPGNAAPMAPAPTTEEAGKEGAGRGDEDTKEPTDVKDRSEPYRTELKTGEGTLGMGFSPRLASVLGSTLYGGERTVAIAREVIQNAIDGLRGLPANELAGGQVRLGISTKSHAIAISDNGMGMSPRVVETALTDLGSSVKPADGAGAFGVAKAVIFGNAQTLNITTVWRDPSGKLIETVVSGGKKDGESAAEQWVNGTLQYTTREIASGQTGTLMSMTLAKDMTESAKNKGPEEELTSYQLRGFLVNVASYARAPFGLSIEIDGTAPMSGGKTAAPAAMKPDPIVRSIPGATITLHTSEARGTAGYSGTLRMLVLNNGIYQFEDTLPAGIQGMEGPAEYVLDIHATVSPEDGDYPFKTDRAGLATSAERAIYDLAREMRDAAGKEHADLSTRAVANAPQIGNLPKSENPRQPTHILLDADGILPATIRDHLAGRKYMRALSLAMERVVVGLQKDLGGVITNIEGAYYSGVAIAKGFVAANYSAKRLFPDDTSKSATKNLVVINPLAAYDESARQVDRGDIDPADLKQEVAAQLLDSLIHELAHQVDREHGEQFAGAQTRVMGRVIRLQGAGKFAHYMEDIQSALDSVPGAWEELADDREVWNNLSTSKQPSIFKTAGSHLKTELPAGRGEVGSQARESGRPESAQAVRREGGAVQADVPRDEAEDLGAGEPGRGVSEPQVPYDPRQLELIYDDAETRPGTTEETKQSGIAALRSLFSVDLRSGATILGSSLWKDFVEKKGSQLLGKTARHFRDLALLAQILRDKRFETMRFFFMKGDTIVGHTAFTSRLPGTVSFVSSRKVAADRLRTAGARSADIAGMRKWKEAADARDKSVQDRLDELKALMEAHGADGYYMMHNHPSGSAKPSEDDLGFTDMIKGQIPGFRGHIVIDHRQYGFIGQSGLRNVHSIPLTELKEPEVPHDLLGKDITNVRELKQAAASLVQQKDKAVVIILSHRMKVSMLVEMPIASLTTNKARGAARLARMVRLGGGMTSVVAGEFNGQQWNVLNQIADTAVMMDAVDVKRTGATVAQQRLANRLPIHDLGRLGPVHSQRVEEEKRGYGASPELSDLGFFSPTLEAVKAWQPKGSVEQLRAHLKKMPGATEEAKWIGLDDFLKDKKTVTRDEVGEFIRANQVSVEEVVRGGPKRSAAILGHPGSIEWITENDFEMRARIPGGWVRISHYRTEGTTPDSEVDKYSVGLVSLNGDDIGEQQDWGSLNAAKMAGAALVAEHGDRPRALVFSSDYLWLSGGSNRAEHVLKLAPPKKRFEVFNPKDGVTVARFATSLEAQKDASDRGGEFDWGERTKWDEDREGYAGGHYPESNVVGWVRTSERVDLDEKRMLVLEEMQSDWGQHGRDEGFRSDKLTPRPEDQSVLPPGTHIYEFDNTQGHWYQVVNDPSGFDRLFGRDSGGALGSGHKDRQLAIDSGWSELHYLEQPLVARLPPVGPFVTKTEDWTRLILRRMIRYATENGFDRIGWTTADQQVERYKTALRSKVDRIEWEKTPEGVHITGKKIIARENYLYGGTPRSYDRTTGNTYQTVVDTREKESLLTAAIGKAMADRIKQDKAQSGVIEGEDITISKTGMAAYYDQIVPSLMDKLAKSWGAKSGTTEIGTKNTGPLIPDGAGGVVRGPGKQEYVGPNATRDQVLAGYRDRSQPAQISQQLVAVANAMSIGASFAEAMTNHGSSATARIFGGEMRNAAPVAEPIHSIDITPKMKQAGLGGLSLFEEQRRYSVEQQRVSSEIETIARKHLDDSGDKAAWLAKVKAEIKDLPPESPVDTYLDGLWETMQDQPSVSEPTEKGRQTGGDLDRIFREAASTIHGGIPGGVVLDVLEAGAKKVKQAGHAVRVSKPGKDLRALFGTELERWRALLGNTEKADKAFYDKKQMEVRIQLSDIELSILVGKRLNNEDTWEYFSKIPYMSPKAVARLSRILRRRLPEKMAKRFGVTAKEQATLSDAVEAIRRIDTNGEPVFGTKELIRDDKGEITGWRWRFTKEQGESAWAKLTPQGKTAALWWAAERETIKAMWGIKSEVEGYLHHFWENGFIAGFRRIKLSRKKASALKMRRGKEGYVRDLERSVMKGYGEMRKAKIWNDFIKQFAQDITLPIPESGEILPGWKEIPVTAATRSGRYVGQIAGGRQIPNSMYNEFVAYVEGGKEISSLSELARLAGRYLKANLLMHPGTAATNIIGGAAQYSTHVIDEFWHAAATGDPKRFAQVLWAPLDALRPSVIEALPDELYGRKSGLTSEMGENRQWRPADYLQEGNKTEDLPGGVQSLTLHTIQHAGRAVEMFSNAGLWYWAHIENYFKRVITVAELRRMGKPIDIKQLMEDEKAFRAVSKLVDTYAFDYENVPLALKKFRENAFGALIVPFPTFSYKLVRMYTHVANRTLQALDFTNDLTRPERLARIMTLATIVLLLKATAGQLRLDKGDDDDNDEKAGGFVEGMNPRLDTTGAIRLWKDAEKGDVYLWVRKYPWFSFWMALEAGRKLMAGDTKGGLKELRSLRQEFLSEGPLVKGFDIARGLEGEYDKSKPGPVKLAEIVKSFIPVSRSTEGLKDAPMQDLWKGATGQPVAGDQKVYPKTFGETLKQAVPFAERTGKLAVDRRTKQPIIREPSLEQLKFWFGINIKRIRTEDYLGERGRMIGNALKALGRAKTEEEFTKASERLRQLQPAVFGTAAEKVTPDQIVLPQEMVLPLMD